MGAGALRAESRYRAWFATLLASTLAITYLSSAFPFELDQFQALRPVGHFLSGSILFAGSLTLVGTLHLSTMAIRRRSLALVPLRTRSVRRLLRELNRIFRLRVVAVTFGGGQDGRIVAMKLGDRDVVGIGRGALPLIRQAPGTFRFCLAHEYAHLAAGDPRRDAWLTVVYVTTTLFLLIAYGSALYNTGAVLLDLGRRGGWPWVQEALLGSMFFALVANIVLFGSIALVLMLESRSAARLREFHADAAATNAVGPVESALATTASDRESPGGLWSSLLGTHPRPVVRAAALTDRSSVYRADMMLFVLLGFFSAFILEMVLQLLFTSSSTGLATFEDRRASVWRYFAINGPITGGIIAFGALLAVAAHVLVLMRLSATVGVAAGRRQRVGLIAGIPLFTVAGTFIQLATSLGTLWDLHQTGWRPLRYLMVGWDRLGLHAVALVALCTVIAVVFVARPRGTSSLAVLACMPVLATLLAGFLLYR